MTQQRSTYPIDPTKGNTEENSTMERVKDTAAEVQDYAGKVGEQVREYGEKAQDAARKLKPYVERSIKEQPMATLAVASLIGFVLGALWKK